MFSILHFYLLALLMLGSLLPAYAQIQWDNVHNTCGSPSDTQAFGAAVLTDIINMAKSAGSYMDNAITNKQNNPWDFYRVMATYDAFFDGTLPDSANRWDTVRANLHTMENILSNTPKVWISCDDTTIFGTDGGGQYFLDPYHQTKIYLTSPI